MESVHPSSNAVSGPTIPPGAMGPKSGTIRVGHVHADPCFRMRRTVGGDKSSVVVTELYEQTCTTVSVESYPRYRAAMERAKSLLDAALVFDKTPSVGR